MPEFEELIERAKDLAGQHPDQVHSVHQADQGE
jgi:hypothetical protein